MKKTLFDKVWDSHVVKSIEDGPDVLFIDRHMVHEVTSPVAFLGLKKRGLPVLHPELRPEVRAYVGRENMGTDPWRRRASAVFLPVRFAVV